MNTRSECITGFSITSGSIIECDEKHTSFSVIMIFDEYMNMSVAKWCSFMWCIASVLTGWAFSWWRQQMETFSALLVLWAGSSPATGEFPSQRPVTRSFDVLLDLRLNKRLGKQSRRQWFESRSRSPLRHCIVVRCLVLMLLYFY